MPDLFNFSDEMQQYFNTLPSLVQESIRESDVKVNSVADLKACAENLMDKGNEVL